MSKDTNILVFLLALILFGTITVVGISQLPTETTVEPETQKELSKCEKVQFPVELKEKLTLNSTTGSWEGEWFTPHAALRKIVFLDRTQAVFYKWENDAFLANYWFDGDKMILEYGEELENKLILKYKKDEYAEYLINRSEGEYFVKSRSE